MRFGSVCSGIEAASVAWHPLGWRTSFLSEIEKFPRAVLSHHYPEVPLHGDFTTIEEGEYEPIDLLVGGTPCQSFSVAGLRGGLDDERGNLALEYLKLADRLRPRWLVWENVPGVLSSNGGRDFGSILGGMVKLGYGFAYRVLDAQFFGVPQRRRRVFVVGYLGDWRRAAAVLFERHSLQGHLAPSRETGAGVAAITANGVGTCGADDNQAQAGHIITRDWPARVAPTLNAHFGDKMGLEDQHALNGAGMFVPHVMSSGQANANITRNASGALDCTNEIPIVCFSSKDHGADAMDNLSPTLRAMGHAGSHANAGGQLAVAHVGICPTVRAGGNSTGGDRPMGTDADTAESLLTAGSSVRRLTPRECERLQGFPDDYTLIPYRKGMSADGPRYKALGNSMAVPVMAWIGQRIAHVAALSSKCAA
jgi:DNA (cytosine-5)-methyltransferase 1